MGDQLANIEFVQEVEKYPVLYNYTLPGYSRRDETEKAWNEVASKVNMRADECKEKWKNIRTVFARRLRPPASGSRPKKPYYLADVMQFAIPFMKTSKPLLRGNFPELPENENSWAILRGQDTDAPDVNNRDDNNSNLEPTPTPPTSPPSSSSVHEGEKESDVSLGKQKRKMNAEQKPEFEASKSIASYFATKKYKTDSQPIAESVVIEKKEETLKMFLLSLLPDLIQFSDSQVRAFRRKVLAVIDEIAEPEPMTRSFGTSTAGGPGKV